MSDIKTESKTDNSIEDASKDQSGEEKSTPAKNRRGGTKRPATFEKTMSETKGLDTSTTDMEGRRRTRSSTRGQTTAMPSPPKKEKREPSKGTGRGRGRPKRQEKNNENNTDEETANNKSEKHSEEETSKIAMETGKEAKEGSVITEGEDRQTEEVENKDINDKLPDNNFKDEKGTEEPENSAEKCITTGVSKDKKEDYTKDSSDSSQDTTDTTTEEAPPSSADSQNPTSTSVTDEKKE